MAATLGSTTIAVNVAATMINALDLGSGSAPSNLKQTYTFLQGTGANQAGSVFADQRTTDNTGESLDMAGGLTNAFGETITFTSIKGLAIRASSANTVDVVIGGAATNAFASIFGDASDTLIVKPGGLQLLVDPGATGYAVTPGTGDLLKIAASATGNVTYDIVLIGEV